MKLLKYSFLALILAVATPVFVPVNALAQDSTGVVIDETPDEAAVDDMLTAEQPEDEVTPAPAKKKGFFAKLKSTLMFWKKKKSPEQLAAEAEAQANIVGFDVDRQTAWHQNLERYMGVRDDDFYRSGYALKDGQWFPVFFLRRFRMMRNQYEHLLVISGRPDRLPRIKGISEGPYGIEISNEGFDYQMPTVASVSRVQKGFDNDQALQLAGARLESFGFEEYIWLRDRKKDTSDLADSWKLRTNQENGSND